MSNSSMEETPVISDNDLRVEENSLICNLHSEVLFRIFKYLSLDDRKCGKLVCEQWYTILTNITFQKEEKIALRWIYPMADIVSALEAYRCPLLYRLHFYGIAFEDYPVDFWKQLGKAVRELMFTQCKLSAVFTAKMVKYCVNLTHLSATSVIERSSACLSHCVLDGLIESEIVRNNLISITTLAVADESWLKKLFCIFPKISELHIDLPENPNVGNFLRNLGQSNFLKKSLSVRPDDMPVDELFHEIPSCTTLETLDLERFSYDIDSVYAANLLGFVSRQKMLKSFRICLIDRKGDSQATCLATQLLHTLFDNCEDLRYLFIHHNRSCIDMQLPLFEKLVASKLQFVTIKDLRVGFSKCPCLQNYNLRYISNRFGKAPALRSDLLQPIFRSLKGFPKIYLDQKTQDSLKSMVEIHVRWSYSMTYFFMYPRYLPAALLKDDFYAQPNLVRLLIQMPYSKNALKIKKKKIPEMFLPLSKLNHLRYLELHMGDMSAKKLQLNLPNLEYLDITYFEEDGGVLNRITTHLPNLKFLGVEFEYCQWWKCDIVKNCRTLKKLQFLSVRQFVEGGRDVIFEEIERLFYSSQSLRIFYGVGNKYVYDRSRNKIFNITWNEYHNLVFNSSEMDLLEFETGKI